MSFPHLDALLEDPVYGLGGAAKKTKLLAAMQEVTGFHYDNCEPYRRLCDQRGFSPEALTRLEDIPYLPASLFKDLLLISVPEESIHRQIHSSATSSGRPSKVGLDRETSRRQSKCFNRVVMDRIGNERRKFIVLDEPSTIGRSTMVSARASTIRSLLFCASEADACLTEDGGNLSLDEEKFIGLMEAAQAAEEPVMLFGFTFILYMFVVKKLMDQGMSFTLPPRSKVIHIGGWKKLEAAKVSPEKLIADCSQVFGLQAEDIVDFYGFTEQSGMLYPTCEQGLRHVPSWAEIVVRDPFTLEPLGPNQEGLLQFLTPIQTSYPGHSVLTEDIGIIVREEGCPCGRHGTAFKMTGRAADAEIRGCGDIMADQFA